jgi:hypothetical protein
MRMFVFESGNNCLGYFNRSLQLKLDTSMRFRDWFEEQNLLIEMPTIRLNSPQSMAIDGKNITADLIDMRFEDWKKFGRQAPFGVKNFAAPLADGRWLNVSLMNPGYGSGIVDSEKHAAIDNTLQSKPYPEISPDWASFGEFLNGNQVVKVAPGEEERIKARAV